MNLQQFNPWNWFKHEQSYAQQNSVPINHRADEPEMKPLQSLSPFQKFHHDIDRMFDGFLRDFVPDAFNNEKFGGAFFPQLDVSQEEDRYCINLEIPGMDEADLSVELDGDMLKIKGEKKEEVKSQEHTYYRVERRYGNFQRVLNLPVDVDRENIHASVTKGVLSLTLPRVETDRQDVKKIEINALH